MGAMVVMVAMEESVLMDTLIWAMVVMVPTDEASTSVRLMPRLPTTEAMVLDPMALDMELATDLAMVMPSPPMATLATPLATVLMAVVFTSVRLMPRLPTTEAMVLDPMALDMELATDLAMVMPSPPMATLATPLATVLMAVDISFKISTHCYQSQVIKKLKN